MPEVRRSFYADEHYGEAYWTYISEELPAFIENTFSVSQEREDRFVIGLSMGGYGAFKLALNYPERFTATASLPGPLEITSLDLSIFDGHVKERVWPNGKPTPSDDPFHLLRSHDPDTLPQLYLVCSTDDPCST